FSVLSHRRFDRRLCWRQQARDLGGEYISPARNSLQQLLVAIAEGPAQFHRALHQGIIGHEAVGPYRLDQFLLADQAAGIFYQILQRFINFGTKLDLRRTLQHRATCQVEREFAKVINGGAGFHKVPKRTTASDFFRRSFGVVSLHRQPRLATLAVTGEIGTAPAARPLVVDFSKVVWCLRTSSRARFRAASSGLPNSIPGANAYVAQTKTLIGSDRSPGNRAGG